MADFPVCPSSERTMSVLPPFCRGAIKTGRFYRKVVSANLFADTLPNSKDCTAQSLSRFATAPFTQGSLSVYPPACRNRPSNSNLSNHRTIPSGSGQKRPQTRFVTAWLPALRAKFQFPALLFQPELWFFPGNPGLFPSPHSY